MIENPPRPLLILVSAPSGAGKTTLCDRLLQAFPEMCYSVSCTTRKPREGEVDGENYNFLSVAEFEELVEQNAFLEHAKVFDSDYYGTLRKTVEDLLVAGRDVLMDVDVQGASIIRAQLATLTPSNPLRSGFLDVFIAPPSMSVLRQRLLDRKKDSLPVIERRLDDAAREVAMWKQYRYALINDDLDRAFDALRSIVVSEKIKTPLI